MLSYKTILNAEDDVVSALHRAGGKLSYPELVSFTGLPNEIVSQVVDHLKMEKLVEVATIGPENSAVRLVRLRSRPLAERISGLFRNVDIDDEQAQ